jgi:hypothetical protein
MTDWPDLPSREERQRWYKRLLTCPAVRDPVDGSVLVQLPNGTTWAPSLDELAIVIADTRAKDAPTQREALLYRLSQLFTEEEWAKLFEHGVRISGVVNTPLRTMQPPEGE